MAKSIYIHLPFCLTKCPYCDFASFAGYKENDFSDYTQALINEIRFRLNAKDLAKIETIFFGGGTPSLNSAKDFSDIFTCLKEFFIFDDNIEISLEANPGTVDRDKLKAFQEIGINRISFGAQTFDAKLLEKLGRGHSVDDSYQTIEDILSLEFKSWSFDLIYGLSGQNLDSWLSTIKRAMSYKPPHISSYALSIEKNTPYGKIFGNSSHPDLPQELEITEMYERANETFREQGLERYEISNWSQAGHEARHNLTYWRAEEYYAFGLSAHGFIDSQRYQNTRDLAAYMKTFSEPLNNKLSSFDFDFCEKVDSISENEKAEEKIMLQLRLKEGLELDDSLKPKIDMNKLDLYKNQGYLLQNEDNLRLSDKAMMVSNQVISDLINS